MALVLADRVRETTTTTGTGTVTLAGAYTGFQTFSAGVGNTNSTYYTIANVSTGEYEVGIGTYTTSGNTLSRTTVLASSNAGGLVNFSAGTKDAFVTQPAERALYIASAGTGLESKVTAFTNGGIVYASSTSALSTGSALTFDGSTFVSKGATNGNIVSVGGSGTSSASYSQFQGYTGNGDATNINYVLVGNKSGSTYLGIPNNGVGIDVVYGSTFSFALQESEIMRLTSTSLYTASGINVGIGTSSPAARLDLAGTASGVSNNFRLTSFSFQNAFMLLNMPNSGNYTSFEFQEAGSTQGSLRRYGSAYGSGLNSAIQLANGSNTLTFDSSGNLGLGVTTTRQRITVGTTTATSTATPEAIDLGGTYSNAAGTNLKLYTYNDGTIKHGIGVSTGSSDYLTATSGKHSFYTGTTASMTLDGSGNLGIGTTSPTQKLDIKAASAATQITSTTGTNAVYSEFINTGGSFFVGRENSAGTAFSAAAYSSVIWSQGLYPLSFFTNSTLRMTLDSSGNLGLGATPSSKLHVKGADVKLLLETSSGATAYIQQLSASPYNVSFFNQNAGALIFGTNNTESARIDSSGNLGIGVTPSAWNQNHAIDLGYSGANYASIAYRASINGTIVTNNLYLNSSDSWIYKNTAAAGLYQIVGGAHYWASAVSGTGGTSADSTLIAGMTLDASGNLLVGTTTNTNSSRIFVLPSSNTSPAFACQGVTGDVGNPAAIFGKFDNNTTTSQILVRFTVNNNTAGSGQITANGANTAAFGSYSDQRLKKNIIDLPPQLENIMALRPVEFDYIESEGGGHQTGFIAQNMESVYPDVVGERKDGMKMIAGWSKTEARLVKAIQEQQALITTLTARITALEGA